MNNPVSKGPPYFTAPWFRDHLPPPPLSRIHRRWRWIWFCLSPLVVWPATWLYLGSWRDVPLAVDSENLTSVYPVWSTAPYVVFLFGSLALYHALYLICTVAFRDANQVPRAEKLVSFVLWTIVPPCFFFAEWFYIFPMYGLKTKGAIEAFKQGQSVTRAMWAGFVALFGASSLVAALKERR